MDVADWLRQLGLGQYEAGLRTNDVTAAVLPSLTAEDLRELGVASVQAPADSVDECLIRSLNTARRQGAHLFELHTATTFARVMAERGERRTAVGLLAPVYGWFTEGFDTADLKGAKLLLNELGLTIRSGHSS